LQDEEHMVYFQMIPYGNAETSQNSKGYLTVKCQHGESECLGNQLQACGINYLTTYGRHQTVTWVVNVTKKVAASGRDFGQTADEWLTVSSKVLGDMSDLTPHARKQINADIKSCVGQYQGVGLHYFMGKYTSYSENKNSVPWVMVDAKDPTAQENSAIIRDFFGHECSIYHGNDKPSTCPATASRQLLRKSFVQKTMKNMPTAMHKFRTMKNSEGTYHKISQ
jgi:hypothetical protein